MKRPLSLNDGGPRRAPSACPTWLGALATVFLTCAGALCGTPARENLIAANFNARDDAMGFRWDIDGQGMVGDGSNDCFDGGLMLIVNGNKFNLQTAMMTADGREYVLMGQVSGLSVTRRVLVDTKRSGARYIEVLQNAGGGKISANVSVRTVLGESCQQVITSTGQPVTGALGPKDIGVAAMSVSGRPCVIFLLADSNSRCKPQVAVDGNRTLTFTYNVEIAAGKPACILHWVAQRAAGTVNAGNIGEQFKPYYKHGLVSPEIPRDLKKAVANFRGGTGLGTLLEAGPALQSVLELAEELGIERGARDTFHLQPEAAVSGLVKCGEMEIEGAYGKAKVPFEEVALIRGTASGAQARLYLRNGEVLAGRIKAGPMKMKTDAGLECDLSPQSIGFLFMHTSASDGRPSPGTAALVESDCGDRLAVLSGEQPRIEVATAWGPLSAGLEEIRALRVTRDPQPCHELLLSDNSRLRVLLKTGELPLKTLRFGEVRVPLRSVLSIARMQAPPAADAAWLGELRAKLDAAVSLELEDATLSDALNLLAEKAGVKIEAAAELDKGLLETRHTLECMNMSAAHALAGLLNPLGLTFDLKEGGVVVREPTEADEAERVEAAPRAKAGQWWLGLLAKLDKKVSFEFVDTPLSEALRFLQSLTGANIILDPLALEELGGDVPITLTVGDMKLGAALSWILRFAGLEYTLRDEAIFVSTAEHVAEAGVAVVADEEPKGEEAVVTSSHFLLSGGNLVVASLGLPSLRLKTAVGEVTVESGRIALIERAEDEEGPGGRPVFNIELADGSAVSGALMERMIPVRRRDSVWNVPVRHVQSYRSDATGNGGEQGEGR